MSGWRDPNPSIRWLLEKYAPELLEGDTNTAAPPLDRRSSGNLDADLADELAEERLFDQLTKECSCRP